MEVISQAEAIDALWRRGSLRYKLKEHQIETYKKLFATGQRQFVINCSRKSGKCLGKDTEILTPYGPKKISEIKVNDLVYGYNSDDSISLTNVLAVHNNGIKEVYDLYTNRQYLGTSTLDHVWLTKNPRKKKNKFKQVKLGDIKNWKHKISRRLIKIPCGVVKEDHAYAIGALLGDGCSKQGKNCIYISSENDTVPKKVANILNASVCIRNSIKNYTWHISNSFGKGRKNKNVVPILCHYYDDWCRNRYAHEKIIDIEIIKTWDRESCLNLLAGLIDTDGCVHFHKNVLTISFGCQSKSIMESVQYLFYILFQYKPKIRKDKRTKYVNGPYYSISISNNLFAKIMLKELDNYLVTSRKKYKDVYNNIKSRNVVEDSVGVVLKNKRNEQCYDISIGNDTNLYLTSHGLVTHNSYLLCILAIEQCLKKPNSIVKYLAQTKDAVKDFVQPIMREILNDCPIDLRPQFKTQRSKYLFKNGSEIQVAGADKGKENLRGGKADLVIVDEAGAINDLNYCLNSILFPTTTLTKGKIILGSTPSRRYDHEYTQVWRLAVKNKAFVQQTIYDNALISAKEIDEEIIPRYAVGEYVNDGRENPEFRREYLAEFVKDPGLTVIPEFTNKLKSKVIREWKKPPFLDWYVSMDIGMNDLTVVLFSYLDFTNDKIVIEDEFVISGQTDMTTKALVDGIKEKESRLMRNANEEQITPVIRVCDTNLIVIADLKRLYGLDFVATRKDDSDAALNNMRVALGSERIMIHPRCETLISHLENVTWNKTKSTFLRSVDSGHYDAVDALIYLVRNINFQKNPYPADYFTNKSYDLFHFRSHERVDVASQNIAMQLTNMYNFRKKLRLNRGK